jgi:hypothetical protein
MPEAAQWRHVGFAFLIPCALNSELSEFDLGICQHLPNHPLARAGLFEIVGTTILDCTEQRGYGRVQLTGLNLC